MEALKESSTKGDLAKKYEISPEIISRWKKELVENDSAAFGAKSDTADFDKERDALHRKIGELEMDSRHFTTEEIVGTLRSMDFLGIAGEGYVPAYTRTDLTNHLHGSAGFRTDTQIVTRQKMRSIIA